MLSVSLQNEFQTNFWDTFQLEKTLKNLLEHFILHFPYTDNDYVKYFAVNIVGSKLIKKSLEERRLIEFVEEEISKIDVNKIKIKTTYQVRQEYKNEYSIFDVDRLNGNEFEKFVGQLLEICGFSNVIITGKAGDQGGDIIATKDDTKYVIQAKRYAVNRRVNNKAVQEVVAALPIYNGNMGIVITNSYFQPSAMELANAHNVELWDRNKVSEMLEKYNEVKN